MHLSSTLVKTLAALLSTHFPCFLHPAHYMPSMFSLCYPLPTADLRSYPILSHKLIHLSSTTHLSDLFHIPIDG
ncbi:hypothetical protein CPC08DRAFT_712116 [Agrocybe pediades]|nr:hypothetical protein CPC08DRAFT_712116 [Agrocybe pediades]